MALRFVTIDEVQAQCRADGDDQANLLQYGEAAEDLAENILNRRLSATDEALIAMLAEGRTELLASRTTYEEAVTAADGDVDLVALAFSNYRNTRTQAWQKLHAMKINSAIKGAILMIAAHMWNNRADVVSGQFAQAQEIPMNSRYVLQKYRHLEGTI